jgi:hypothetical protein
MLLQRFTGNLTLFQEIKCYEDALNLYETVERNRSQLETMLQAALAEARRAMREVTNAEDRLLEADLQVGRARTIIKKCGFASVLERKNCIGVKITESNCSFFFYIYY